MGVSFYSPKNLSVLPVQINTKYQNAKEVKADWWATKKWRQSSVPTTTLRSLNLPTKLIFQMLKNESSNVERKSVFKVSFNKFLRFWIETCILLFKNLLKQAHVFQMNLVPSPGFSATRKLLERWVPKWFVNRRNQTT